MAIYNLYAINNNKVYNMSVYVFNIFTGKVHEFNSLTAAIDETKTDFKTIKRLMQENRPNYNTGWMYSDKPREVWLTLNDILNYKYKKPGYYRRLYSGRYKRMKLITQKEQQHV